MTSIHIMKKRRNVRSSGFENVSGWNASLNAVVEKRLRECVSSSESSARRRSDWKKSESGFVSKGRGWSARKPKYYALNGNSSASKGRK
jgi:hypothetical protein